MNVRRALVLAMLPATALATPGPAPTPWPTGAPPSEARLNGMIEEALALADRERREEFMEAAEKGEDSEHILVRQVDIDAGMWDLEQLFAFGDALFDHEFRASDGYGAGSPGAPRRVHQGARGGLDTYACAGCHAVGGPDGAGSETQSALLDGDGDRASTALVRNPPALLGLGLVQGLAAEMTYELRARRDEAVAEAVQTGAEVRATLASKGVEFGALTARPDGSVDTGEVVGVDPDLEVRPFFWKGTASRLRRVVEDAARVHFGVQSQILALGWQPDEDAGWLGPGPDWFDPDADGVANELQEGALTAAALYLAMLEAPVILPPFDPGLRERWARGNGQFTALGCAECHREALTLADVAWAEHPDTTGADPVVLNLLTDGEQPRGTARVRLYSDLRRHDMGPALADPRAGQGVAPAQWLTRPLWGLAETAPYMHDGRAATIPEAIAAHDGEARDARDAFLALDAADQADLHIFLLSLTREPKVRVPR